ncbi:DHS-like NAD/FAD-binding domain-containing protein [Thamnocephalis sphaerospora]|uniref:deoxyhypusine synthase n=1 Tax=Thamnocephalis sphaerospora TaxID=78915 RepID=A0A4P9XQA3_9FUNG|nr:DHS-like NAD/FAD-binding domain-containing protein [Thamnocephalis sphaerospora]|eukprot:RKP08207.1 DHS-like NAD/FAD-binding domain-containing protein [Thamnocephalis sphaerospora]
MTSQEKNAAHEAVYVASQPLPLDMQPVRGYDFNQGVQLEGLLDAYLTSGFQATALGQAIEEVNKMLRWRMSGEPVADTDPDEYRDPATRSNTKCTIFFGYTSNLVSSGLRETIRYLAQHRMIDCIVTTAGGIEEDFIKCLAPTYIGDFALSGKSLRERGLNRIGNLVVPNDNYCKFEDWMVPILDAMVVEQEQEKTLWTPSKIIDRLGKEINHPDSIYYWCHKNNIPVFCPALTDGALGDLIYFHSFRSTPLVVDIASDLRRINTLALRARHTGMIILGGGVVKHHICNANLMRNGADHAVYINTGQEFDGSDAGARPDEAVSWGKIRPNASSVKVYAEATLVFPLIVARTFAHQREEELAAARNSS